MAHEQLMEQEWTNCTDDIPTTDPDLSLANLDISKPEHPILRRWGIFAFGQRGSPEWSQLDVVDEFRILRVLGT